MSDSFDDVPSLEQLLADPEIAALLDFAPVPRKVVVEDGWSPDKQREFIARLAVHGSANKACTEMGKNRTGMTKVANSPDAREFRAAWDGAVALARRRREARAAAEFIPPGMRLPTLDNRVKLRPAADHHECPRCAEHDAADRMRYLREHEESILRVRQKLFMARRAYLFSIADDPPRRAAWELLCGPMDWAAARTMGEQPDEKFRTIRSLRHAALQVPLTTGFVPGLTEPDFGLDGDMMAGVERSLRRNDPRYNGTYGTAEDGDDEGDDGDGEGEEE